MYGGLYTCMECKGKFPLIWPVYPRPYIHSHSICMFYSNFLIGFIKLADYAAICPVAVDQIGEVSDFLIDPLPWPGYCESELD